MPKIKLGIEKSCELIVNEIRQNGPYDGVMAFSEGCIIFRTLYQIVFELDKEKY